MVVFGLEMVGQHEESEGGPEAIPTRDLSGTAIGRRHIFHTWSVWGFGGVIENVGGLSGPMDLAAFALLVRARGLFAASASLPGERRDFGSGHNQWIWVGFPKTPFQ